MGLFHPIKKGTYKIVAENIALIYYNIKINSKAKNFTLDQKLFATALIDTAAYDFGFGGFGLLTDAVVCAHIQQVSIFPNSIRHGKNYTSNEFELLVGLTMQLLAIIFELEFKTLSPDYMLRDIVKKKPFIESTINKALAQNVKHPLYEALLFNTNNALLDPLIVEIIEKFDLEAK